MATVQDVVAAALREIGVLAAGQDPAYEDAADALESLNDLVDQWAAERLQIFTVERTVWPITANQQDYLFGGQNVLTTSYSDSFDGEWINGLPPNWTVLTQAATITEEVGLVQDGASALRLSGDALENPTTLYRDFSVPAGAEYSCSIYLARGAVGNAILRIQNRDTLNYLTSAGAWQAASADALTATGIDTYSRHVVTFSFEEGPTVGDANSTIRVLLTSTTAGQGYFDLLTLASTGGGAIPIPRPVYLGHVTYFDTSNDPILEIPLSPLTDQGWMGVSQKALTSTLPTDYYYNPTVPNGRLSLWPIPTSTTLKLAVYVPTAVTTFESLSTELNLPPAYKRMLVKNLALELAPSYGRAPHPLLPKQAADAVAVVKRANKRLSDLAFPAASLIGSRSGVGYNIHQG